MTHQTFSHLAILCCLLSNCLSHLHVMHVMLYSATAWMMHREQSLCVSIRFIKHKFRSMNAGKGDMPRTLWFPWSSRAAQYLSGHLLMPTATCLYALKISDQVQKVILLVSSVSSSASVFITSPAFLYSELCCTTTSSDFPRQHTYGIHFTGAQSFSCTVVAASIWQH